MRTKLVKLSEAEYELLIQARELLKKKGTDHLSLESGIPISVEKLDLGEIIRVGTEIIIHHLEQP